MNSDFKKVRSYVDGLNGYELVKWLGPNETGWDKKIDDMFDTVDISVLQKCWMSILYELPVTIVTAGYKNDKDVEILSDYKEIFALMQIYGISKKVKLYFDPVSCELALAPSSGFYPLEDIYDTYKLVQIKETSEGWIVSESEKKELMNNMDVVNSRMQSFYITLREVCCGNDESTKTSVRKSLKAFYSK